MSDTILDRRTVLTLVGATAATAGASGTGIATIDDHDDERTDDDMRDDDERTTRPELYVATLRPQEGVQTKASGLAVFQRRRDRLTFVLTVSGIEDTFMSHVHEDEPLGPIALWLHEYSTQDQDRVEGTFTGLLDAGTITDDVLAETGAPEAESDTVDRLVETIQAGKAYVNVHTEAYPDGEIAGRIERFDPVRMLDSEFADWMDEDW